MKFGEKGWKSVIESTKPKDYKEELTSAHFSYELQVGRDGVWIELSCNYSDPNIDEPGADDTIEENFNTLVDWKDEIIKTLEDPNVFGFSIKNMVQLDGNTGYNDGLSTLEITIRK